MSARHTTLPQNIACTRVNIAGFDNGSFHLNVHGSGTTSTTFMDATGISALIEALTNALTRVEQVQP